MRIYMSIRNYAADYESLQAIYGYEGWRLEKLRIRGIGLVGIIVLVEKLKKMRQLGRGGDCGLQSLAFSRLRKPKAFSHCPKPGAGYLTNYLVDLTNL